MKRLTAIAFGVSLLLFLGACDTSGNDDDDLTAALAILASGQSTNLDFQCSVTSTLTCTNYYGSDSANAQGACNPVGGGSGSSTIDKTNPCADNNIYAGVCVKALLREAQVYLNTSTLDCSSSATCQARCESTSGNVWKSSYSQSVNPLL